MGLDCAILSVTAEQLPEDQEDVERLDDAPSLSLDRYWDAIHWAFGNASAGALGFIQCGGEPVEAMEIDDWNNARFIEPDEVRRIAAAIADLTEAQMAANLEPRRSSKERYPDLDIGLDDIRGLIHKLRKFVDETVAAERGLLVVFDG